MYSMMKSFHKVVLPLNFLQEVKDKPSASCCSTAAVINRYSGVCCFRIAAKSYKIATPEEAKEPSPA